MSSTVDSPEPVVVGHRTPHHFGYVVDDLAVAARRWHEVTGIGPFLAIGHVVFDEVTVDGAPAVFDHSAAFAAHGEIFVELQQIHHVEPAAALRRFQPLHPRGLNHVAYAHDDPDAESVRLSGLGAPRTFEARTLGLHVIWHDTSDVLGFAVELHQDGDALRGFFAEVSAAARDWDGREVLRFL
jgi:hypothetical protein